MKVFVLLLALLLGGCVQLGVEGPSRQSVEIASFTFEVEINITSASPSGGRAFLVESPTNLSVYFDSLHIVDRRTQGVYAILLTEQGDLVPASMQMVLNSADAPYVRVADVHVAPRVIEPDPPLRLRDPGVWPVEGQRGLLVVMWWNQTEPFWHSTWWLPGTTVRDLGAAEEVRPLLLGKGSGGVALDLASFEADYGGTFEVGGAGTTSIAFIQSGGHVGVLDVDDAEGTRQQELEGLPWAAIGTTGPTTFRLASWTDGRTINPSFGMMTGTWPADVIPRGEWRLFTPQ